MENLCANAEVYNKKKLLRKGVYYDLIGNVGMLIDELERYRRSFFYDDFQTEFLTVELDGEEYLIANRIPNR